MPDKIVSAEDAQGKLPALLELVKEGHEVLISEGEEVIARLAPVAQKKRTAGLSRGAVRAAPDFDEPLPESFWEGKT